MNKNYLAATIAAAALAFAIFYQPGPPDVVAAPQQSPSDRLADAIDSLASSQAVLADQISELSQQIDADRTETDASLVAIVARLDLLESAETKPAVVMAECDVCPAATPSPRMTYSTTYAGPRGIFGGRFAPGKRIWYRLRHPFGGRFRRR